MSTRRQVVIVIHGIGEQRPMDTLRSFVTGVLGPDAGAGGNPPFYNKPDPNAEGFELRRIRVFDRSHDTDFVEFYWQHLMPIAPSRFLFSWLWTLMQRPARDMPPRFRFLWWLCWIATLFGVAVVMLALANFLVRRPMSTSGVPELSAVLLAMAGSVWGFVLAYVGDAAIYLNPHPRTVEARNAIRSAGVALLERLHADDRYTRIIVAGHSLGSVIAYDMLRFAWNRTSENWRKRVEAGELDPPRPSQPALDAAEALAARSSADIAAGWRAAVLANYAEHRKFGLNWMVSDLVTLGSPLAHGDLLLAGGRADLARRQRERELPTSPPHGDDGNTFSFPQPVPGKRTRKPPPARVLDHAALFAVTTWTNLYFPCRHLFYGDPVGGTIANLFGPGVRDRAVRTSLWGGWLSHTFYWNRDRHWNAEDGAVRGLIEALDLNRAPVRGPATRPSAAPGSGG